MKSDLVNLTQAAALKQFGCRQTLSRAYRLGRLKGEKVGGYVLVSIEDLDAWLKIKGKHQK